MKKIYFISLAFLLLVGCQTDNPFLSDEVIAEFFARKVPKPVEHVVVIVDNDIYYFRNFDSIPRRITSSPTEKKTHIKISNDHQKIAYLNASGNPVIIDTTGNVLATLSQFNSIKQMDWSNDGATLYMLINNDIQFYGPAMDIPEIDIEHSQQVLSAAITKNNDLIYILQHHPFYHRPNELVIRKSDGEDLVVEENTDHFGDMSTVNISKDGDYVLVGYSYFNLDYEEIDLYPMYGTRAATTFGLGSTNYTEAHYDHFSKYLVAGQRGSSAHDFTLIADFTYDPFLTDEENSDKNRDKYLTEFKGSTGKLWIDWK